MDFQIFDYGGGYLQLNQKQEFSPMFNLFNKLENADKEKKELERKFIEERLRELKLTFNLALCITAASAMMALLGVGLFYFDKVQEAKLTVSMGILASVSSVQFAKDRKAELEEIMRNFKK
ncbi:MAG TPA: hypothetical protein VK184_04785 [Nostocaceae cyanobacterium]|nr:hypothetical protein [Nostocaceae cyanobacterium]